MQPILSISDKAAEKIKCLLEARSDIIGLRIKIKTGGCSGKSYDIEYANSINAFEEKIQDNGVVVLIDPKALMYLIGSKMDYVDEEFKSGFVFINPNEKGRCGCGKSFSV